VNVNNSNQFANKNNQDSSKTKTGVILFKVNVKLDSQMHGKIFVRKGDSLWSLAQKFAITHKLDSSKTQQVYELLQNMYND